MIDSDKLFAEFRAESKTDLREFFDELREKGLSEDEAYAEMKRERDLFIKSVKDTIKEIKKTRES